MSHNDGKKKLPIYVGHAKMTTSLVGSLHLRDEKNNFRHQYVWKKKCVVIVQRVRYNVQYIHIENFILDFLDLPGKVNC